MRERDAVMKRVLFLWLVPIAIVVYGGGLGLERFVERDTVFRVQVAVVGLLAGLAGLRAGLGFASDGLLRWAWILVGVDYLAIAASAALPTSPEPNLLGFFAVGWNVFVNIIAVSSLVYFVRAYRSVGFDLGGSRARRLAVIAVTIGAAFAIDLWPIVTTVGRMASGDIHAVIIVVSSVGDLISLSLVGPIFLTALALRGGVLVWPWALLSAANLVWLLVDAQLLAFKLFPTIDPDLVQSWCEKGQVATSFLTCAAALAQAAVSRGAVSSRND